MKNIFLNVLSAIIITPSKIKSYMEELFGGVSALPVLVILCLIQREGSLSQMRFTCNYLGRE